MDGLRRPDEMSEGGGTNCRLGAGSGDLVALREAAFTPLDLLIVVL
jgi:hypothetical protein